MANFEQLLLELVENISDACVIEAADGSVEMVNAAFCTLFELSAAPQSLVGMDCASLFADAAKNVTQELGPRYVITESAAIVHFATEHHTIVQKTHATTEGDGDAGRAHIFCATAKASDADIAAATVPTTAFNNLAEAVSVIQRMLAEARRYDWPDTTIVGLQNVQASTKAAFASLAQLVDCSRPQTEISTITGREFMLRESLAALFATLSPMAETSRVTLSLRVEQDVHDALLGDAALLMDALHQLIENVLETTDGGSVELTVQPEYSADDITHVSFTVQSDVAASPAGNTVHLTRANRAVRILALAGGDKSGGKLDARKNKTGIAWQFTVPLRYRTASATRLRPQFVTLTGVSVLIVSTNAEARKQLATLIHNWRMQPREADNAAMALFLLRRMAEEGAAIPLVITANDMPLRDGFMLAFQIKHDPLLKDTVVMMLAQDGKPGDAVRCRESGISAYLRHPIRPDQLHDAIMAVLGAEQDAEATHTLVTRHSLRESRTGTVLIVDAHREDARAAAIALRKRDYRVVIAETAGDAAAALLQDIFEVVILDATAPGFASVASAPAQLRTHLNADRKIAILAALSEFAEVDHSHYQGVLTKPYEKVALLETIASVMG